MWKETKTKSSEGRRTKPEPVEETVTVTAHTNIQFMYTLAMHHRGISFSPVPEITFSSQSIHRIWLVKGRKYLKKFVLSISRECVLPWRKVRKQLINISFYNISKQSGTQTLLVKYMRARKHKALITASTLRIKWFPIRNLKECTFHIHLNVLAHCKQSILVNILLKH